MKPTPTCAALAAVILSLGVPGTADDWTEPVRKAAPQIKARARDLRQKMIAAPGVLVSDDGSSAGETSNDGVLVSGPTKPRAPVEDQPYPGLFDSNVPADTQRTMVADLAFVKTTHGSGASALHRQIFGYVEGGDYFNFFQSRVKKVCLDTYMKEPGVMAYVRGSPEDHSKMWLTNNYINYSMPRIARVEIIFHESRHTEMENGYWPHARCPTPFLDDDGKPVRGIVTGTLMAGHPACDTTAFGSYAAGLIMVKNIQKFCTNCTGKVQMDAGLIADDTLKRIIDPDAKKAILDDLYR